MYRQCRQTILSTCLCSIGDTSVGGGVYKEMKQQQQLLNRGNFNICTFYFGVKYSKEEVSVVTAPAEV